MKAKSDALDLAKEEIADLKFQILEKDFNDSIGRMKDVEAIMNKAAQ